MTLEVIFFGAGNYVFSLCGKYIRQDNLITIHLVSTSIILIASSLILPEFYLSIIDNYIIQFCPRGLKCFTRVFCSWTSSNFGRILFCFVQFGATTTLGVVYVLLFLARKLYFVCFGPLKFILSSLLCS